MGNSKGKQSGISFGAAVLLFVAGTVILFLMGKRGLSEKWEIATIFCTLLPFASTFFHFKKRVSPKVLWTALGGAFLIHVPILWVVFGVILRKQDSIGILVCAPGIIVECFILYQCVKLVEKKLGSNVPVVHGE